MPTSEKPESPLICPPKTGADPPPPTAGPAPVSGECLGMAIGPYKLLQQLGEGGMGTVWVAEQSEPVKRRVAIKVVKPGMDSALVLARFEAERQALALMEHTNIAKVFDAGTTDNGRPYFVMELVKGVPITKYCDELHLTVRERLELFVPVCQAIQHAHQKGIIHRDVKPSNVLVCVQDGKPVPKVIDFGVAKALHQKLAERTLYTEFGAVVGTLEYMSPEQAELSALDIDTRSDLYSLGVVLYELLTGTTPLSRERLRQGALTEALRVIREEEPPRPSSRLTSSKNSLASLAALRRADPKCLAREFRRELDWIVMKCLEKDRMRRYATANGLARDLERYLHDETVEACPPSRGYRLLKFARRNKQLLATAAAFLVLLLAATAVSAWLAVQASEARRLAEERLNQATEANEQAAQEAHITAAVNDFLLNDLLAQADLRFQAGGEHGRDPDLKVRTLLDRAAQRIEGKFRDQPLTEASIRETIGRSFTGLQEYEAAEVQLERALALRIARQRTREPATLHTQLLLADVYTLDFKCARAEALLQDVLHAYQEEGQPNAAEVVKLEYNLAGVYRLEGKYDLAEPLYRELLQTATSLGASDADLAGVNADLGYLYAEMGRYGPAEQLMAEAVRRIKARHGPDHPATLTATRSLAVVYGWQARYNQAEELLQESLRVGLATHRDTAQVKKDLAALYIDQGKYEPAEKLLQESIQATTADFGPTHPRTLFVAHQQGVLQLLRGKHDQAASLLHRVADGLAAKLGKDHPTTLTTRHYLAALYQAEGKTAEAETLFQQVLQARTTRLGADHPDTLATRNSLGLLYQAQRKYDQAEALFRDALSGARSKLGPAHPRTRSYLRNLCACYESQGQPAKAEPLRRELAPFKDQPSDVPERGSDK